MPRIGLTAAVIAAAGMLATSPVASAATSPVVSREMTSSARRAPLTIPGTGVKKGARLPRGARLVSRTVTLEKGQKVRFTISAPAGKTLRGLAPAGNAVRFAVVRPVHYVGHRTVRVRAFVPPRATAGKHTERIWALVA